MTSCFIHKVVVLAWLRHGGRIDICQACTFLSILGIMHYSGLSAELWGVVDPNFTSLAKDAELRRGPQMCCTLFGIKTLTAFWCKSKDFIQNSYQSDVSSLKFVCMLRF